MVLACCIYNYASPKKFSFYFDFCETKRQVRDFCEGAKGFTFVVPLGVCDYVPGVYELTESGQEAVRNYIHAMIKGGYLK